MTLWTMFSSFALQVLNLLSLATWLSIDQAKILLIVFFFYLCFVLICTRIYVYFSRKQTVCKRTILFEYNRFWYQVAQTRHEKNNVWDNFFAQQIELLSKKWSTVYFSSKKLIDEYLLSIEKKLWVSLSQQNKDVFIQLYRRYSIYRRLASFFLLSITVLTLGIIRIFVR